MNDVTDERLMAAYVAGDRRAFDALFQRFGARIHGFFMRSFGDPAVADDLMQTTFLKLHRARAQFRGDLSFRPWLYTIAARVRLDELRRRYRLPEDADEDALERAEAAGAHAAGVRASDSEDLKTAVRRALEGLPESMRAVVHLHRFEGLTFAEIGRVLGATETAVKLRAFRAYGILRVALKELAPAEAAS